MENWDKNLKEQVARDWKNYRKHRIDLTTARVDENFTFTGDFLYAEGASSETALASVRLNRNTNEALDIKAYTKIRTVFTCLYISNTAQSGEWLDLIVGVNFEKEDPPPFAASPIAAAFENITGVGANDDITFESRLTTEIMVLTNKNNIGDVWINLDAGAIIDTGWPLDAGEWVKMAIGNMDRLNLRIISNGDKVIILRTV